jgi:YVTN family beta-propeller protein
MHIWLQPCRRHQNLLEQFSQSSWNFMKRYLLLFLLPLTIIAIAQKEPMMLPNGWALSPAGKTLGLGDLPLNMAVTPNKKFIAVTNNGWGVQSIQLIDAANNTVVQTVEMSKSWLGLQFADDEYLYASAGNDNMIMKYQLKENRLVLSDSIVLGKKWPEKISPAGLAINNKAHKLYTVTKENNSLYICDLKTNKVEKTVPLGGQAYTCMLAPKKNMLYISVWSGNKVLFFDTKKESIVDSVATGVNPNDICVSSNGKYLFVSNSVDNSVSVIDVRQKKVIESLNAALFPNAPCGSTPNSVALSADGERLYIANADNNCLAVFNVSKPAQSYSMGFIPTEWYPTCVRTLDDRILVLNGKGKTSLPNPAGPQPVKKGGEANYKKGNKKNSQYIGGLFLGTISFIPEPTEKELAEYSKQVYKNSPYTKEKELNTDGEIGNPIPMKVGAASPIKHVFYVMKENRTYDQVLGDEPEGNGDTSLVLFGKKITPNLHALAENFVLLDNFYVDAEVSADGHNWSMAAYANDYVEKTWPTNYSGRGGTYDYAANKKVALPKNGFIWDYALRAGIATRDYGEFTDDDGTVYLEDLKKIMCPKYPGWNLGISDTTRERIWEHDFDSLSAMGSVPQLNILYFPNDHTAGLGKQSHTPSAFVAENDLAVGLFLEHLSHSQVWKDCAVFILEDDAQNGPDHVDAHRSTAYLAGPYVKRGFADHTMYATSGMLRTIELILGLPPMSQYDAGAIPLFRSFTKTPNLAPITHLKENIDLNEMNTAVNYDPLQLMELDLSAPDKVRDDVLNEMVWKAVKANVQYPAGMHAAFVKPVQKDDE